MKCIPILLVGAGVLAFAGSAVARQHAPASSLSALPPPGLHDPGVDAHAPVPPATISGHPLPALPGVRDDGPRDARGEPPPTVTVRKHNGDTIEEYRQNGRVVEVRVTPKHGLPYTYTVDAGGKLRAPPGAPPVKPVMYKILEWDKPAPPPTSDNGQ